MKLYRLLARSFPFVLFFLCFSILFVLEGPISFPVHYIKDFSDFLPRNVLINDEWFGIYYGKEFIGYSHSTFRVRELLDGGGYSLNNKTVMEMPVLGSLQTIDVAADFFLDRKYELEHARFKINSRVYVLQVIMERTGMNKYAVTVKTPSQTSEKEITLAKEIVIAPVSPLIFHNLPLKNKSTGYFYNPILDKRSQVFVESEGMQNIIVNDNSQECRAYSIEIDGIKGKIYTDTKGYMVKQEFLGFNFVKEDISVLFRRREDDDSFDFARKFSIDSIDIPSKETLSRMKVKIEGIDFTRLPDTFRQLKSGPNILTITRNKEPNFAALPLAVSEYSQYLKEDEYITFKENLVGNTAKEIVGQEKDCRKILSLFLSWMNKNIVKTITFSVPHSLDVIEMKRGDCGELSVLLVGFLRSVGIPAYVNVGVVHHEGAFFYHAWVSAYVGEWIEVDPAFNQENADVTHITLVNGLRHQFDIIAYLEKMSIDILEYE